MAKPLRVDYEESWKEVFGPEEELESWLMAELLKAFYAARKAKRSTNDEQKFEMRMTENLLQLRDDILHRSYVPGYGIAFIIHDPVMREIFAAPFRDRVIHHFLYNQVVEWWDRRLIDDCYSCRVGKGTLYGVRRMAHHIKSVSDNYTKPAYAIKMDVQGYFMSLPRKGLFERVCWGLDRQFPNKGPKYDIIKYLWKQVIFDDPIWGVQRRGNTKEWDILPKSKSLFAQPPGKGIVIGNLSSQLLSNVFLDQLDRFVKFDLKYKHYGRYVDDFYVIVTEEEFAKAKKDVSLIALFLTSIGLTLHPRKTHIQEVHKGVPFLGVVVYPGRIVPGKRVIGNYQRAILNVQSGTKDLDTLVSYMGMMKHINGYKTQKRIFGKAGLDYNL
ncbi:RNA-directed DNA polymerase [Candidatus Saccharibacteria bacterium]|nr:RNA-directed DNA polymerase [Candidatus Saccharibacteria bacterium]